MIESLVGNRSAERVLFFLQTYGEGYAGRMATVFATRVSGIQQQLRRFENGGIIVSRLVGRTRVYQFNPRCHYLPELRQLLGKAMLALTTTETERYYRQRTRPRRAGKP